MAYKINLSSTVEEIYDDSILEYMYCSTLLYPYVHMYTATHTYVSHTVLYPHVYSVHIPIPHSTVSTCILYTHTYPILCTVSTCTLLYTYLSHTGTVSTCILCIHTYPTLYCIYMYTLHTYPSHTVLAFGTGNWHTPITRSVFPPKGGTGALRPPIFCDNIIFLVRIKNVRS